MYGEAVVEARALGFQLASVRGPGQLAIRLSGRLADGRIEVRDAIAARTRESGNTPRAFHLPGLTGGPNRDGASLARDAPDDVFLT